MTNLTVIGLYFSLETVIFAFYGKFHIKMRMSPYSANDVRMDLFLGFVLEMESRLYERWTIVLDHECLSIASVSIFFIIFPCATRSLTVIAKM